MKKFVESLQFVDYKTDSSMPLNEDGHFCVMCRVLLTENDKVYILNPELISESSDEKLNRLDIHVETAD